MDTILLEAFVAVAETGSFSVAAEKVHITQPAISKRVAQLESFLDCRLFDRISRTVHLTEAGAALLPRARAILRELKETRQAIHDLSGEISGTLSIAISHHIGLHRLPPVLKTFASKYPRVSLAVEFMDSEVAYEGILHGEYEVAVITLAPEPHPKIRSDILWHDPLTAIAAADHPLASSTRVTIQNLGEFPAILPGLETYTGRMIKHIFEEGGYSLQANMATNYLETIKMLVSVGLGWSILPLTMLDDSLRVLPCPQLNFSRQLGYLHHREKTLSNAATAFITLLRAMAEETDTPHGSDKRSL
jgi:DNA-binding transcriptional LysR family regulator